MVSRKKTATNKGRKAAKQGKKTPEANGPQKQRLKVTKNVQDEDDFLDEAIMIAATEKQALEAAAAAAEERRQDSGDPHGGHQNDDAALREGNDDDRCWHGFKPSSHRQHVLCYEFVKTFGTVHNEAMARNEDGFVVGIKATEEKHPEAWKDMACIKAIISWCLRIGTKLLCEGKKGARLYATLARYFEEVIAVDSKIQNDIYWTKVFELYGADEHTLVKYFRRRIPCNCLNERYNEVKHLTKLGICYNPNCPLPDRKTDRCKLRHCTKCRLANYCSIECQRADWKSHKKTCVDWTSKSKTEDDVLEVADTQCHEKMTDIAAMSKALAQEWSEKAEKHCTQGW